MSTPRPTPETDNLILSCGGWGPTNHEWREHARDLERERDEAREQIEAMREAIREAHEALEWTTKNMNPPFEWEPFTRANAALAKLKPFILP